MYSYVQDGCDTRRASRLEGKVRVGKHTSVTSNIAKKRAQAKNQGHCQHGNNTRDRKTKSRAHPWLKMLGRMASQNGFRRLNPVWLD